MANKYRFKKFCTKKQNANVLINFPMNMPREMDMNMDIEMDVDVVRTYTWT